MVLFHQSNFIWFVEQRFCCQTRVFIISAGGIHMSDVKEITEEIQTAPDKPGLKKNKMTNDELIALIEDKLA